MNWGTRIFISYLVFAVIVFTMVFISMNQDINLVSADYYKREIEYEDQIQRIKNTQALLEAPEISFDRAKLMVSVQFPKSVPGNDVSGSIHLFRPSDSSLDKKYRLELDESGEQNISVVGHSIGLWKVKLDWEYEGTEYYQEQILNY